VTTTLSDNTTTTLSANVEVIPIWIPKAFSPDNDGINDVFKPEGYYNGKFIMQVFSRGGQMVFESNNMNLGWDGTFRGEKMPDGVYAYVISVSDSKDNACTKKGAVTLLRR
jgi:gliding motility-associated-like protein